MVIPALHSVEAWSTERIQFPPVGWQTRFRERLAAAIDTLDIPPGAVLHAEYASGSRELCDAENVLFYNIGARPFAEAARSGLRFERRFDLPPASTEVPDARHYYRYRAAAPEEEFRNWVRGRILVKWEAGPFHTVREMGDLAHVWRRVHEGRSMLGVEPPAAAAPFGIAATLYTQPGSAPRLAGVVKTIFDGVVSAFHVHDGSALDEVSGRLARKLPLAREEIAARLMDRRQAVLGERVLIRPRQPDSVHWYPGDDLCVGGALITEPDEGTTGWRLSGSIFELLARPSPG